MRTQDTVQPATLQDVQQFLARECAALDEQRWADWQQLYAPDAVYWMPAHPAQTDMRGHVSLLCDDAAMRALRVRRHAAAEGLSLCPVPRTVRFLSNITIEAAGDRIVARANLHVAEYASSGMQQHFARVTWILADSADGLRIEGKRVDLLGCEGLVGDILFYL